MQRLLSRSDKGPPNRCLPRAPSTTPRPLPHRPGLWTARAIEGRTHHSPSRRASRESHLARPINRHRIVIGHGAITLTSEGSFASRLTACRRLATRCRWDGRLLQRACAERGSAADSAPHQYRRGFRALDLRDISRRQRDPTQKDVSPDGSSAKRSAHLRSSRSTSRSCTARKPLVASAPLFASVASSRASCRLSTAWTNLRPFAVK